MGNRNAELHFFRKRRPVTVRCRYCGRFMSYEELSRHSVTWTPHGNCEDIDPPDAEWSHVACWLQLSDYSRNLVEREAWQAPIIMIDDSYEYLRELRQIHKAQERIPKAVS